MLLRPTDSHRPPSLSTWLRRRPWRAAALAAVMLSLVVTAAAVGAYVLHRQLPSTTALPSLGAALMRFDAAPIVRRGSSRVWVIRFDTPVELVPHHYRQEPLAQPLTIVAWQRHLGASMVFNAGQFDDGHRHLGWLKADGVWLSPRHKPAWLALLLSGPLGPQPWGRIADLQHEAATVAAGYAHVVQSMMLLDHLSQVRVRRSQRAACRTVVAQDGAGRLLLVVTEGAVTLHELARWLAAADLDILRAMNLDGGAEAQLAIATDELRWTLGGGLGAWARMRSSSPLWQAPLPAVIAVRPLSAPAQLRR